MGARRRPVARTDDARLRCRGAARAGHGRSLFQAGRANVRRHHVMGRVVVRARSLSKRYTIGGRRHDTLGGALLAAAADPSATLNGWRSRWGRAGDLLALDDVSFDVEAGQIVGIIGRNGAGKSTLLKLLSRITQPTRRHVDLTGRTGAILDVGTGFHDDLTG